MRFSMNVVHNQFVDVFGRLLRIRFAGNSKENGMKRTNAAMNTLLVRMEANFTRVCIHFIVFEKKMRRRW